MVQTSFLQISETQIFSCLLWNLLPGVFQLADTCLFVYSVITIFCSNIPSRQTLKHKQEASSKELVKFLIWNSVLNMILFSDNWSLSKHWFLSTWFSPNFAWMVTCVYTVGNISWRLMLAQRHVSKLVCHGFVLWYGQISTGNRSYCDNKSFSKYFLYTLKEG